MICRRIICWFSQKNQNTRLPSFSHFPLYDKLFSYLESQQIHTPTYIQYALLSSLQRKKNIPHHITSPTGSGKTLAYMLPLVNSLKKEEAKQGGPLTLAKRPRALVITSNKQLVLQCRNVGKDMSHHCKIKIDGIGLGRTLIEEKKLVENGVDILASTFSRLQPMIERQTVMLSNIRWVVIDELDTLYDTGKLRILMKKLIVPLREAQRNRQIDFVLSGTTCSDHLKRYLSQQMGKDLISLMDKNTHLNLQNIRHEFTQCFSLDKHQTLLDIYYQDRQAKTIIFCSTVDSLHNLQYFLESKGVRMFTLHSQLSKQIRLQNYQLFRDSINGLLLSTDLGARGLHFPALKRVINYDFPKNACDYLQRVGRCGRAGQKGHAISIYHKKDLPLINELKDCSFDRAVKLGNSAYGMKNRQQTGHKKYK